MDRVERAASAFEAGFACSQAVFSAFAPELGLDRDLALKIAAGFGGGMGRMGETCGAVTGAMMALGLKHGHTDATDKQAKERAYEQVRELAARFAARNGTITCRNLLDFDIGDPQERQLAKERGLFTTLCPKFVRDAAEILEQMLAAEQA